MVDVEVVLMHPLMVLIRQLPVLIRGIEGGALVSTTGAKAWIGGAHRVEYSKLANDDYSDMIEAEGGDDEFIYSVYCLELKLSLPVFKSIHIHQCERTISAGSYINSCQMMFFLI